MTSLSLLVESINIARPAFLGIRQGEPVHSSIRKRPVETERCELGVAGFKGDGQADVANHGGPEMATYAYPTEHRSFWRGELDQLSQPGPGVFGENLTTTGAVEDEVCIGDIWTWGSVVLQVSQPRFPCHKLAMATGEPSIVRLMVESGRTGWYFRVLEPGMVDLTIPMMRAERGISGVSVSEAHRARLPGADRMAIERVVAADGLSNTLRDSFRTRLNREASSDADG